MAGPHYPPEHVALMRECRRQRMTARQIVSALFERFGVIRTPASVRDRCRDLPTLAAVAVLHNKTPRSLAMFARQRRKAKCAICSLMPRLRKEVESSREKPHTIRAWLEEVHSIAITEMELTQHRVEKHAKSA